MVKERLIEFDLIRIVSCIFIIFYHRFIFPQTPIMESFKLFLGFSGVAMFFFISGYLLYLRYETLPNINDMKFFFINRILKIFPLYWTVWMIGIILIWHQSFNWIFLIIDLLGIQIFFIPKIISETSIYASFWFISGIIVMYGIYPLIVAKSKTISTILLKSIAIFFIFYSISNIYGFIYQNFLDAYFYFIIGIVFSQILFFKSKFFNRYWYLSILIVSSPFMVLIFRTIFTNLDQLVLPSISNHDFIQIITVYVLLGILIIGFIILLYGIFQRTTSKISKFSQIISICSISTYPVFLIHQKFYDVLIKVFSEGLNVQSPVVLNILIIAFLPVLFIIGYYFYLFSEMLLEKGAYFYKMIKGIN